MTQSAPDTSTPDGDNGRLRPLRGHRLLLAECFEPLVRIAAWFGVLAGRSRFPTEMKLRGALLGGASSGWRIGRNIQFAGAFERFRFGEGVVLYGNTYLDAHGKAGTVTIGARSHVDQFCVLYGQGGLSLGPDCAIASGVVIYSQSNQDLLRDGTPVTRQPPRYAAVRIGDAVWIGAKACILPGVSIGAGSIVGAGSVVLHDIPAGSTAYGVPARIAGQRQRDSAT
ncbi:MAG TPA: acyltransferase [Burkholderiales bacterium]|nr:acyltransferase [Burkholderiales bacterium]